MIPVILDFTENQIKYIKKNVSESNQEAIANGWIDIWDVLTPAEQGEFEAIGQNDRRLK